VQITGGVLLTEHPARHLSVRIVQPFSVVTIVSSGLLASVRACRPRAVTVAALPLFAVSLAGAQGTGADTAAATLTLGVHPWLPATPVFADVQRIVRDVHTAAPTALSWTTTTGGAVGSARAVLQHIAHNAETSRSERRDALALDSIAAGFSHTAAGPAERALFDLGMGIVVARHAFVHRQGRIDPSRVHAEWSLPAADVDLTGVVTALTAGQEPGAVFAALEPQTRAYQLLVQSLAAVRAEAADQTQTLPAPPARAVAAGGAYADARALARVLVGLGELPANFNLDAVRGTYSRPLSDAVARWQNRKLKRGRERGVLTASVLETLLTEYRSRGDRIAMAIERWRWLPRTFSNDPLVVNLPEYRLHTYDRFRGDSVDQLSMNVVIGRADSNATPVFSANMTQVVFSPRWYVPKSIQTKEIQPAATANPGYLEKHNYELTTTGGRVLPTTRQNIAKIGTTVMVRQRSGDDNSLGKVKFLLPNPYDIYLHDTPSRSLFSRVRRDFSHGCVRLGDPMAMARYVLGSQPAWTDERITEAMNAGIERYVRVPRPIPVLIVYQTAVANPDGALRYFNDVYGHDRTLADALDKAR
jgi:L,D-transpeptidase YcbB